MIYTKVNINFVYCTINATIRCRNGSIMMRKFAFVFAVYLLENEILVLSRGGAFVPYFKALPWDFHERPAPLWGICSFSQKKTNAGGRMGTLGIE